MIGDVSLEKAPNAGAPNPGGLADPATLAGDGRANAYEAEMAALGLADDAHADQIADAVDTGAPLPTAPETGEPAAEAAPKAGAEAKAEAPAAAVPDGDEPPQDWAPSEDVKAAFGRLNRDQARVFRGAFFRDAQFKQYGFKPQDAKLYKETGFTPDRARKTLERFPTAEDEEIADNLAASAQEFVADFTTNPERFLQNLYQLNPDAFASVVKVAAPIAPKLDPVAARAQAQRTYEDNIRWHFKQMRENAQRMGREDLAAAADLAEIDAFGAVGTGSAPAPTSGDPELDRQREELRLEKKRLADEQRRMADGEQAQFNGVVVGAARNDMLAEITKTLDAINPSGFSQAARKRVVNETFAALERAMAGNPRRRNEIQAALVQGRRDRAHAQQAYHFITSRARPMIPAVLQETLKEYLEITAPPAPAAPAATKPAAPASTQARRPAPAPSPRPAPAAQQSGSPEKAPNFGAPGWKGMEALLNEHSRRMGTL